NHVVAGHDAAGQLVVEPLRRSKRVYLRENDPSFNRAMTRSLVWTVPAGEPAGPRTWAGAAANTWSGAQLPSPAGTVPLNVCVGTACGRRPDARLCTRLERARILPVRGAPKVFDASASSRSTTTVSYAGTTPLRSVGNATSFASWLSRTPATLNWVQPRTFRRPSPLGA